MNCIPGYYKHMQPASKAGEGPKTCRGRGRESAAAWLQFLLKKYIPIQIYYGNT